MKIEEINETVVDFAIIEKSEEKNEFLLREETSNEVNIQVLNLPRKW